MGRYFITAGFVHWLLSKLLGPTTLALASEENCRRKAAIAQDIKLSTLSAILFALSAACFMVFYNQGLTKVYLQWDSHSWGYGAFSYFLILILQDAYFYGVHRLFHQPRLFRWFHQGHHRSRTPTPWTSFAFDPLEAMIQASFLLAIALVIPLHIGVLITLLLTMTVWALGNHLGLAVVPPSAMSRWWGSWCIGSAHHLVHHRRYTRHYGLYFTLWDRVFGTQDDAYEVRRRSISWKSSSPTPALRPEARPEASEPLKAWHQDGLTEPAISPIAAACSSGSVNHRTVNR